MTHSATYDIIIAGGTCFAHPKLHRSTLTDGSFRRHRRLCSRWTSRGRGSVAQHPRDRSRTDHARRPLAYAARALPAPPPPGERDGEVPRRPGERRPGWTRAHRTLRAMSRRRFECELCVSQELAWVLLLISLLSVAMYTRAAASDYDDWATVYGNKGWSSADLLPLLRKVRLQR